MAMRSSLTDSGSQVGFEPLDAAPGILKSAGRLPS